MTASPRSILPLLLTLVVVGLAVYYAASRPRRLADPVATVSTPEAASQKPIPPVAAPKPDQPLTATRPDWPCFQGDPALAGQAVGTMPERLRIKWRVETDGEIIAAPIVANGTVYVAVSFAANEGDWAKLFAFALADGAELATARLDRPVHSTPCLVAGRVLAADDGGTVHVFPAIAPDLRPETWEELGRIVCAGEITAPLVPVGDRVFFGSHARKIYGLDARNLALVWQTDYPEEVHPASAVTAGQVVTAGCGGGLQVNRAADGELLGRIPVLNAEGKEDFLASAPTVVGGRAYLGTMTGRLVCVELATGKTVWETGDRYDGDCQTSFAVTEQAVLAAGFGGRLLALDPATGRERWQRAIGEVRASPVVAGNIVWIGAEDGYLRGFELPTGKLLAKYELGNRIPAPVAVAADHLVVVTADGQVVCFGGE